MRMVLSPLTHILFIPSSITKCHHLLCSAGQGAENFTSQYQSPICFSSYTTCLLSSPMAAVGVLTQQLHYLFTQ